MKTSAEVIQFERSSDVKKEEFVQALQIWRQTREVANALSKEEIGELQGTRRIDALRKATLYMLVEYYRKHQRADVAPGVAAAIAILSDNDRGVSTISQQKLATLFGRSRTAIAEAQARLREDGLIQSTKGRYAANYPVVPRALAQNHNHTVWLVDAICAPEASLNCQTGLDNCQLPDGSLQLIQLPVGTSQLESVNCQVESVSIAKPDLHNFTKENSEEKRGEPPRQGMIAKVAGAMAATITTAILPVAAHPVEPAAQVQHEAAECWQTQKARYDAEASIHEKRAQRQVWMTPLGVLEVAGDFKLALEQEYPLVELREGLAVAAPNVRIAEGAIRAMQSIRRSFSYRQRDAADKEKRAQAYAKKPDQKGELKTKPEGMPDKIWAEIQAGQARERG